MKYTSILFIVLLPALLLAQDMPKVKNEMKDTTLRTGQLQNGFRYVMKNIPNDKGKVKMNLIVKAGSSQEEKDQFEMAHLLEHIAYNTTEHFPDLRNNTKFFSSLGLRPQDLSAQVGGYNTQYKFYYPQDSEKALDTALLIYHDIVSGKVLFNENDVQAERKALYQETLYSGGPEGIYLNGEINYLLTGCSDVPEPDMMKASILNSSTEPLKRFYKKWYVPNRMVLAIVGKIENMDNLERKIRQRFQNVDSSLPTYSEVNCDKNYLQSPEHFIVMESPDNNKDLTVFETEFRFYVRNKNIYSNRWSKEENKLFWEVLGSLITDRMHLAQANYNINYKSKLYTGGGLPAAIVYIWASGDQKKAVQKVFSTLAGFSQFGFKENELQRAIQKIYERLKSNDKSTGSWLKLVTNQALEDEPLSTGDQIQFLESLNVLQVNRLVKKLTWKPDDIVIVTPNEDESEKYSKKVLQHYINEGLDIPEVFTPLPIPEQLLSQEKADQLDKARIVNEKSGEFKESILEFANGLKVILRKQPFKGESKNNKMVIHGFSPYGASCFGLSSEEALLAPSIIRHSGVGKFNKFQIDKFFDSTSLAFNIKDYITPYETGIKAQFNPDDLEKLLQFIYLSFTEPRYDPNAFKDWKWEEFQRLQRMDPINMDFNDFVKKELGEKELAKGTKRYTQSLKIDYRSSFNKYKKLHGNARDFTFIVMGDLEIDQITPLLQKYLGNLPNQLSALDYTDLKEEATKEFNKPHDAQFNFNQVTDNKLLSIAYQTPLNENGFKSEIETEVLTEALNLKLKKLRYEKKLGVYFSNTSGTIDPIRNLKTIRIYLQTNPNDFEEVLESCELFIKELKTEPVSEEFLENVKKSASLSKWTADYEDTRNSVINSLYELYRFNKKPIKTEDARDYIDNFDSKDLMESANQFFKKECKSVFSSESGT